VLLRGGVSGSGRGKVDKVVVRLVRGEAKAKEKEQQRTIDSK
jgi:hypothetical protein